MEIIFQQLFENESSTYTYLIADPQTQEAVLIDPVLETLERDLQRLQDLGLKLKYSLETHIHADHITGAYEIKKRTSAQIGVSAAAAVPCADLQLEDGQELKFGNQKIKVITTPGHTKTCVSYFINDMVFTGDALLIDGCGRTDFQQGSSDELFHSVREKLFKLPDSTKVYPGHDYQGRSFSTIENEKKANKRLNLSLSKEQFKTIMSELKLAMPKKINEAVPANLNCGQIQK